MAGIKGLRKKKKLFCGRCVQEKYSVNVWLRLDSWSVKKTLNKVQRKIAVRWKKKKVIHFDRYQ